jgi:hypothetical protein
VLLGLAVIVIVIVALQAIAGFIVWLVLRSRRRARQTTWASRYY